MTTELTATRPAPGDVGPDRTERVLGLDIGGTKLAVAVVDSIGTVEAYRRTPTDAYRGPAAVLDSLFRLARETLDEASGPVLAAGIGCGGPLDPRTGTILGPPGLPGWDSVPLVSLVTEALGMPAFLENDGSAGALGAYRWGGWQGVRDLVYLTVSTGVGGGIVLDGRLRRGAAGNGGELGHLVVDWQGRPCGCGQLGCAEAYVSGPSIARRAAEALIHEPGSALAGRGAPTARDVAAAAAAGDFLAGRVWEETVAMLGRVVAVVVNLFEPDLVVLGGGVTNAGAMLIEPVRKAALAAAMPPAARAVRVELTSHGEHAGVLGAAAVAFEHLGEPER